MLTSICTYIFIHQWLHTLYRQELIYPNTYVTAYLPGVGELSLEVGYGGLVLALDAPQFPPGYPLPDLRIRICIYMRVISAMYTYAIYTRIHSTHGSVYAYLVNPLQEAV